MLLPQEFRTAKEGWAENLKNIGYNKINKQQNGIRTIYIFFVFFLTHTPTPINPGI